MMGGDVTVESEPGAGSTFNFTFLVTPVEAEVDRIEDWSATALSTESAYRRLRGIRILLVEDNMINREVARAFLKPLDPVITEAENGKAALDFLAEDEFDLVLMDVRMPVMDGLETTGRIREADADWSDLPVVALTANASDQDANECLRAGMDSFAIKPLKPHALFEAMIQAPRPPCASRSAALPARARLQKPSLRHPVPSPRAPAPPGRRASARNA